MKLSVPWKWLLVASFAIAGGLLIYSFQTECWSIDSVCLDYVGELRVISGTAEIRHGYEVKTLPANKSLQLKEYDEVIVSSDGLAEIVWNKYGRSLLAGGTALRIVHSSFTYKELRLRVAVTLFDGRIWSRIERPLASNEYFSVLAGSTVAATGGEALFDGPVSFGVSSMSEEINTETRTEGVKILQFANEPDKYGWYLSVDDVLRYEQRIKYYRKLSSGSSVDRRVQLLEERYAMTQAIPSDVVVEVRDRLPADPRPLSEAQRQDPFLLEGDLVRIP